MAEYPETIVTKALILSTEILREIKHERDAGRSGQLSQTAIGELLSDTGFSEAEKYDVFFAVQAFVNVLEPKVS